MSNLLSKKDNEFRNQVESCEFPVPDFDHRAHVRLAYAYLAENSVADSIQLMRDTIIGLLKHVGIDPTQKYRETLTKAWILAVHHFKESTEDSKSADEFMEKNGPILDSKIMLTHYSAESLFSEPARKSFVEPDLAPIPKHNK